MTLQRKRKEHIAVTTNYIQTITTCQIFWVYLYKCQCVLLGLDATIVTQTIKQKNVLKMKKTLHTKCDHEVKTATIQSNCYRNYKWLANLWSWHLAKRWQRPATDYSDSDSLREFQKQFDAPKPCINIQQSKVHVDVEYFKDDRWATALGVRRGW